ncbi:FliC/FljB family flagellin [Halomonas salipaludis]|uniref:Flagellin n=1 Tax=Halomonas salipaludis TaxID=2032625 RepID=A0A2A2EQD7_9GAMM|nr:FliC/FljB family flagellin [Halomonas salipaludis]PAU74694.1 flagellin FliC [Halomonas salipaludis]
MSVINTNITSMIGQSNLSKSQNALQTSMERLSSGLRINSAKDDAAGQAIANRMTAQITGLSQAQRNANDGISVAQTAEGSLNQINDNLQRIRELSVQAQNGTNSQDDLTSIQDEINQRLSEIDRISEETSFNGVEVLASDQGLQIQVGANDGEAITVNLKEINSSTLGMEGFTVSGLSGEIKELTLDNANGDPVTKEVDLTGLSLTNFEADSHDQLKLRSYDDGGTTVYVVEDSDGTFAKLGEGASVFETDADSADFATITTDFADGDEVTAAKAAYDTDAEAGLTATANPMATLDAALKDVDSLRSELGAVQNRFEDAITNLQTNETNLSAARSRIEDADYAVEVADMTRAQILQQAGTSVLAQANQIPQNVLSLLG